MATALKPIGAITTAILLADTVWLTTNYKYYNTLFESIQHEPFQIRWFSASLVYVLIVAGIYILAVREAKSLWEATGRGAFLGLLMYGLYDLTNYATLNNYTFTMTLSDMLWGTFLCAIGAACGYFMRT